MRPLPKIINAAASWRDLSARRDKVRARPLRVHLEVNDYCNLSCPMCGRQSPDIPKNTGAMDLAVVEALRPVFRTALNVGLAGNGEPFLHPRLFDILDVVVAEKAAPAIITNATLIDEETARRLVGYGPMILLPSVDGGTKEVYEAIRRPAVFEQTRENLLTLKREKERAGTPFPIVHFLVTLCAINEDDLPNVVELAHEVGAVAVDAQSCYPQSEESRRLMIEDPARLKRAFAAGREAARRCGVEFRSQAMSIGVDRRFSDRSPEAPMFCQNVWTQLHVLINGDVRICCFSKQETIGNVLRDPLDSIWNHPRMVAMRRAMREARVPTDCVDCHLLLPWAAARPAARGRREFIDAVKG